MELNKKEIGQNVKKARDIKSKAIGYRYTASMLARDIGISQSYMSDIETGRTNPSTPVINAIAEICGVSLDFLMGKEKKKSEKNKPEAHKIISEMLNDIVYLPVIGDIAAGTPILVEENIETYLPYPKGEYDPERHFILRVKGDSMRNAGIFDGDIVVIRKQPTAENGQIVAVHIIDDGIVLKKYYKDNDRITLKPCNDNYKPIEINSDAYILGVVEYHTRKLIK